MLCRFLYDEQLPAERSQLLAQMKKASTVAKKERLRSALNKVTEKIKLEKERRRKEEIGKEVRRGRNISYKYISYIYIVEYTRRAWCLPETGGEGPSVQTTRGLIGFSLEISPNPK